MEFKLRGTNLVGIELIVNSVSLPVEELKGFLKEKKELLRGSRLVISLVNCSLKVEDVKEVVEFFKTIDGICFCGFKTNIQRNREVCSALGIPCDMIHEPEGSKKVERHREVQVIRGTLRSGDRIVFPGDIIIMGDVNPGAEIEAGGSVYVMGSLRGTVKAGVGKNDGEVRAMFFQAPRLEVCGKELTFDRTEKFVNFRVRIKDGKFIINPKQGSGTNGG